MTVCSMLGERLTHAIADERGVYRTQALPAGLYLAVATDRHGRHSTVVGGARCAGECDLATASYIEVVRGADTARIDAAVD